MLIRNPWGARSALGGGEWDGPWSDGAEQWTPYWMAKLNHKFGDDGVFWMEYKDLLRYFRYIHRTRLFGPEWNITQVWTRVRVSWVTGYQKAKFIIKVPEGGPVVIVLSQPDSRYFIGLEGQYSFVLNFQVRKINDPADEYILRTAGEFSLRSVSAEIDLEKGEYEILPKLLASRDVTKPSVEEIVEAMADKNPQKLRQIGVNHDIANVKGMVLQDYKDLEAAQEQAQKAAETAKVIVTKVLPQEEKKENVPGNSSSEVSAGAIAKTPTQPLGDLSTDSKFYFGT
jgi:hypothetical protein